MGRLGAVVHASSGAQRHAQHYHNRPGLYTASRVHGFDPIQMMNQQDIKHKLDQWLTDFVEANNSQLGNWPPCPYARAARLSGMISTVFATPMEFVDVIRESTATLTNKDVVVVCFDHHNISPEDLQEFVASMNRTLMPVDYVILEDHPDAPEYVNGVKMNFGLCGLLVIQRLSKLNNAADRLREKGYYDTWDKAAVDDVVTWRYQNEILQN